MSAVSAPRSALDSTLLRLLEAGRRYDELRFGEQRSRLALRTRERGVYRADWAVSEGSTHYVGVRARTAADALCALKLELERHVDEMEQERAQENPEHTGMTNE